MCTEKFEEMVSMNNQSAAVCAVLLHTSSTWGEDEEWVSEAAVVRGDRGLIFCVPTNLRWNRKGQRKRRGQTYDEAVSVEQESKHENISLCDP